MKKLFVSLLIFLLFSFSFVAVRAQSDVPTVDLSGYTWNKATLHALTITNTNETWWQPYFVNITQRTISNWNQAMHYFANTYPDYAYLSSVNIVSEVSDIALPDYDIYINFSQTLSIENTDALGLTTTLPFSNGTTEASYIVLSARSGNIDLTNAEAGNVALHELGHALGLGHSNSSVDVMYPYYDIFSTNNAISTLDLYALALSFSWVTSPDNLTIRTSLPRFTTLPSNVPFAYAPVENPAPQGVEDNPIVKSLIILFSDPFTAIMAVTFIIFLIVAALVYRSIGRQHHKAAWKSG